MISIIDSGKLVNTDVSPMVPRSCEMVGLSTDSKPTGVSVGNGWSFIEMDTGKVFFYDGANSEWLEFAGSGGGSGGGSNVLIVTMDVATYTLDKTWQQINDAPYAVITFEADGAKQILYIATIDSAAYQIDAFMPASGGAITLFTFFAESASGYPVAQIGD